MNHVMYVVLRLRSVVLRCDALCCMCCTVSSVLFVVVLFFRYVTVIECVAYYIVWCNIVLRF